MHLKKIEELKSGRKLFVFFSNDKGRGKNNCTIQVVTKGEKRNLTAKLTKNVLAEAYTTSWKGDINFSKRIQEILGVKPSDLVRYKEIKRIDNEMREWQGDACTLNFDIIWMKIEQKKDSQGKSDIAIITSDQLKEFSRSMYSQGWNDNIKFERDKNGFLAKVSK